VNVTPKDEEKLMDLRSYAPKRIRPDQVRDGPIRSRIIRVFEDDKYSRPVLELENGSEFLLNEGNNTTLMKAWGYDSDHFIGQELELFLDFYKDWKSDPPEQKETVKARPISPAKTADAQNGSGPASKPLPPSVVRSPKARLDDDIPF